ncbi:hypothetical protein ACIQ7N_10420 [Lysinibacillus sp. NPDC095746]|uniref:hypothetical protein n=1 Tax=Lysinibacillus TaxID=400634 RepID=UPI0010F426CF|nr:MULTISPECIES: hypothetical protein [unclassified Lysinibacillus]MDD1504438.1 hypothetical protein [Lysinibacillus sp. CNPSo 3705]
MVRRRQQQAPNGEGNFLAGEEAGLLGEDTGIQSGDITSTKVELISSMVLTIGYSLATLSTILALQEEEANEQARTSDARNQSVQFRQMHKHLSHLNNRLDSIERKLNRY